jgi:hypothetical protein
MSDTDTDSITLVYGGPPTAQTNSDVPTVANTVKVVGVMYQTLTKYLLANRKSHFQPNWKP